MSSNDSFITNDTADLTVPIVTEIDLDINAENILNIVAYVFPKSEDNGTECRVEFEEVIDKLINYYENADDQANLNQIYSISHELTRQAERLRTLGINLEEPQESFISPVDEVDNVNGNSYELEKK